MRSIIADLGCNNAILCLLRFSISSRLPQRLGPRAFNYFPFRQVGPAGRPPGPKPQFGVSTKVGTRHAIQQSTRLAACIKLKTLALD